MTVSTQGNRSHAERIEVNGTTIRGTPAQAKRPGANAPVDVTAFRQGKETVLVQAPGKTGGPPAVFERTPATGGRGNTLSHEGVHYTQTSGRTALARTALEASRVAAGGRPTPTPEVRAAEKAEATSARVASLRADATFHTQSLEAKQARISNNEALIGVEVNRVSPGLRAGIIEVQRGRDGDITLVTRRPPNVSDAEYRKLVAKARGPLGERNLAIDKLESQNRTLRQENEGHAASLRTTLNDPDFAADLAKRGTPTERLQEVRRYTDAMVGTRAGAQQARDLFLTTDRRGSDASGQLAVGGPLSRVVAEAYNTGGTRARVLTAAIATPYASELGPTREASTIRLVEIARGRSTTAAEGNAIRAAVAERPDRLITAIDRERAGQAVELPGQVSEGLSLVADAFTLGDEKSPTAGRIGAASSVLATVQTAYTLGEFASDPTVRNGVGAAGMLATTLGGYASLLDRAGVDNAFVRAGGRIGGVGSVLTILGGIKDLQDARSPEGRESALRSLLGTGAGVVGAALGGPAGLVVAGTGFLVSTFNGAPSGEYDAAFGALEDIEREFTATDG